MEKVNRYFLLYHKYNKHYQTFTHVGGAGSRVGDGLAMLSEWFGGEGGSGGSEWNVRLGATCVRTYLIDLAHAMEKLNNNYVRAYVDILAWGFGSRLEVTDLLAEPDASAATILQVLSR